MMLHDNDKLQLPDDLDNKHYVSFSNHLDAIGVMITGTKAEHVKFGHDLNVVNKTLTLYNANVPAMMAKWEKIKSNRQLFDLLEWNCARTLLEVLNEGYPDCQAPLGDSNVSAQLWTPNSAYGYITKMQKVVNKGYATDAEGKIAAKTIRARYIPRIKGNSDMYVTIAAIAIGSFVFNVVLALVVIWAVIRKMQADAEAKLERGLAKIILYAGATWPGQVRTDPRFQAMAGAKRAADNAAVIPRADDNGDGDNAAEGYYGDDSGPPTANGPMKQPRPTDLSVLEEDEENPAMQNESPDVDLLCPSPHLADAIVSHMDKEDDLGVKDGETDKEEFIEWATKVKLDKTEIDLVWRELDRNNSGKVDKREWDDFLHRRKKLKWLIGTMKSVRKMSRGSVRTGRY